MKMTVTRGDLRNLYKKVVYYLAFLPYGIVNAQVNIPGVGIGNGKMPWESPLQQIQSSVSGPVLTAIMIVATIIIGLLWAVGESGGAFKRAMGWLLGGAIAGSAVRLISTLFKIG